MRDSRALLTALNGSALVTSGVSTAAELLVQILDQDIEAPEDPDNGASGPRLRQGVAPDRLVSTVDPEMRHGRKSASKRFDGFKVHITEDLDHEWITNLEVTPANTHDGAVVLSMLTKQEQQLGGAPEELLGDSQYGLVDTRAEVQEAPLDVKLVAKLPGGPAPGGRFSKADFRIDLARGTATCPAGEVTTRVYASKDGRGRPIRQFRFPAELCQACQLRSRCTRSAHGRGLSLHYHEDLLQAARAQNATPVFQQRYHCRALVERKLGELRWRHGLRYGRYLGVQKMKLQALWTATVVNLKRLCKLAPAFFTPPGQVLTAA